VERRVRLISAIARGRRWLNEIMTGSITDAAQLAKRERCTVRQINLTLSLAFLAPQLVKAAVEGSLPRGINIEWAFQKICRDFFSFPLLCREISSFKLLIIASLFLQIPGGQEPGIFSVFSTRSREFQISEQGIAMLVFCGQFGCSVTCFLCSPFY
jgi:hypothetical protein